MNAVDATAIAGVVVMTLTTLIVPWWLRRRAARGTADRTDVVSWQGLNASLKQDVDNLRTERDRDRVDYKARLRELEEEHARQRRIDQLRIEHLEAEVARLSRIVAMQPYPGMGGGPGVG